MNYVQNCADNCLIICPMKTCTKCHVAYDESEFYKEKGLKSGLSSQCRYCKSAAQKARYRDPERKARRDAIAKQWKAEHPEEARRINLKGMLKFHYGMTLEQYDALLEEQDGLCAICGKAPKNGGQRLYVDHDHDTGAIRGLLCVGCNVHLGWLEAPGILAAALIYLGQQAP
jgi:hypothetical protein